MEKKIVHTAMYLFMLRVMLITSNFAIKIQIRENIIYRVINVHEHNLRQLMTLTLRLIPQAMFMYFLTHIFDPSHFHNQWLFHDIIPLFSLIFLCTGTPKHVTSARLYGLSWQSLANLIYIYLYCAVTCVACCILLCTIILLWPRVFTLRKLMTLCCWS